MTMGKRERTHFPRPGARRVRTHNLSTSRKTRKPQQIKRPIDGPPQLQHRGREVWKVRAAAAVGNGDQTRAFRSSFSLSAVCTRLLFNTSAGLVHTNTHLLCTSAHTHTRTPSAEARRGRHSLGRRRSRIRLWRDNSARKHYFDYTAFCCCCCSSSSTYFTFLFPFVSFLIFCAVSSCTSFSFFFFSIHRRVKPDGMMMILLISITILFLCFFFFLPQSISSPAQTVNILLDLLLCWSTRNLV